MKANAPVVLFVYRRPEHTRRTLESLSLCDGAEKTDLWVFSDGPKSDREADSVAEVRALVRSVTGFRSVQLVESPRNQGLAASVIAGVGKVLSMAGTCIVVEDDLVLAPGFLSFLNQGLDVYRDSPLVFTLSGYTPPRSRVPMEPPGTVWFAPRPCSWGWAIWKDRWDKVDWTIADRGVFESERRARKQFNRGGRDLSYFLRRQFEGSIDSWAIRMAWNQNRQGGLTAYPTRSFVDNRGLDGTGTHSQIEKAHDSDLSEAAIPDTWPEPVETSPVNLRRFRRHYEGTWVERWIARLRKVRKLWR